MLDLNGSWKLMDFAPGLGVAAGAFSSDFDDSDWPPVGVPGDVHTALVRQGRIEPPFFNMNVETCQWVEDQEWWYRRSFQIDEPVLSPGSRFILRFDGLDTFATIYLNGAEIGQHANMFIGKELDVTSDLRPGDNLLAVCFDPVMQQIGDHSLDGQWASYGAERVWARKAQYNFSWDWAPRLLSAGIWQDVILKRFEGARLADVFFKTVMFNEDLARVAIDIDINRWTNNRELGVEIVLSRGEQELVAAAPVSGNRIEMALDVFDPAIWWTHDLGEPALYDLEVRLLGQEGLLDVYRDQVGIRTIEVDQSLDPEEPGTRFFTFVLNGVPLFARGADWIPADSFVAQVDEDRYRDLLRLAVEANMNCLRVWGGGIYEKRAFYQLCDQFGLLVWQDFMFACALYPDFDPDFVAQIEVEADAVVRRLRNHPSIAMWCGSNENIWIDDLVNWDEPGRDFPGKTIYHQVLPDIVDRLDGTRLYWPSSPFGGNDHNDERQGNRHNWQVWHGAELPRRFGEEPRRDFSPDGVSFRHYGHDMARFISEFGMHASPVLETLRRNVPETGLRFASPELLYRNKDRPKDKGNMLMRAHTGLPASLQEYVDFSMIAQAEGLKFALEHYRRRKFHCSGTLFWQLNDCWPGLSWSVLDYYHFAKAGYFYAKRAYAPLMASFQSEVDGSVSLWVVNDTLAELHDSALWTLATFDGETIHQGSQGYSLDANVSRLVTSIPAELLRRADPRASFLHVRSQGSLFPDNRHFFVEIKDLLRPQANLEVGISEAERGLDVQISSDLFAYFVQVVVPVQGTRFSDNYIDLLPGEKRLIQVRHAGDRALTKDDVVVSCLPGTSATI